MNQAFLDYFRCPTSFARFSSARAAFQEPSRNFFRVGNDLLLYGSATQADAKLSAQDVPDIRDLIQTDSDGCSLPFDPTEVADNLRLERYVQQTAPSLWKKVQRELYYAVRPLLATSVRRHLQKASLKGWQDKAFPKWPVDCSVDQMFRRLLALAVESSADGRIPFIWFWPRGYEACAIMTHDVETQAGLDFTPELKRINASFQIPASYQLIPGARYCVTPEVLNGLKDQGCEVNVHDLKHDGHLFDEYCGFQQAASLINGYAEQFGAKGFRAGALYRNQSWFKNLRVSYDMSVPNVAHLDPQSGGCCTVMPYFVGDILELPVTATQDYSLFNILETFSLDLWRQQTNIVLQHNGLLSFIVHPDYLDRPEAVACYTKLLSELSRLRAEEGLWTPLPREVDTWWRQRAAMSLVPEGRGWRLEGDGAERACIAYATLQGGELNIAFSDHAGSTPVCVMPTRVARHDQLENAPLVAR